MSIPWTTVVSDLEARGWSVTEIARANDKSPQSISDIKHGRTKEPNGMAAVRLHELHRSGAAPAPANDDPPETTPEPAPLLSQLRQGIAAIEQGGQVVIVQPPPPPNDPDTERVVPLEDIP